MSGALGTVERQSAQGSVTGRLRRAAWEVAFAAVPALIAAALHLAVVTWRREVLNTAHWDWNTRDIGWIVPAGYLLVFSVCALLPAVIAGVRRAGLPARARIWFWTALVVFSVLLLFTRVHSLAWLLIALGLGFQTASLAVAHPVAWRRMVRGAGMALAVGFLSYATITLVRRAWEERAMLARIPTAPGDAPNVLLIIWDTARAQNMSLYGYGRPTTPFLDSLAAHAVVFEQAYSTAPWTLPSHATMLTGEYPSALTADWTTRLDEAQRTVGETLQRRGYVTGGFVANFFAASYPSGLHRGFVRYEDTKRTLEEVWLSTTLTQSRVVHNVFKRLVLERWYGMALSELLRFDWRPLDSYQVHDRKIARSVTGEFLRWQSSVRRPFFAMLNYMEAHAGYAAPSRAMFSEGAKRQDEYDGAIWWLDRELRTLVAELQRRGELERTAFIVTSDHGEQFGEHGMHGHGVSLYAPVLRVPLVIYAPGRLTGGVRVTQTVSLRDVARTLQDLAGVQADTLPGASLVALATDSAAPRSPAIAQVSKGINQVLDVPIRFGDLTAMLDDTLHVIRDGTGKIEAYAYRTDSAEAHDLARDPARRLLAARLLAQTLRVAKLLN